MKASKLGEKARQHHLAAWELAVREAQARTAKANGKGSSGRLAALAGANSDPASPSTPPGGVVAGAPKFPCPHCPSRCKSKSGLQAHIRNAHKTNVIETSGEEPDKP